MDRWGEPQSGETDVIADAVRTYPLTPVPPGLASAIMSRIQSATPQARFELKWIDLALALFGASMTALAWLLWQWLPNWPAWANALAPNALVPLDPVDIAFGAIGIVGGLLVLGVCLVIALVLLVPRPVIRLEPIPR